MKDNEVKKLNISTGNINIEYIFKTEDLS